MLSLYFMHYTFHNCTSFMLRLCERSLYYTAISMILTHVPCTKVIHQMLHTNMRWGDIIVCRSEINKSLNENWNATYPPSLKVVKVGYYYKVLHFELIWIETSIQALWAHNSIFRFQTDSPQLTVRSKSVKAR